MICASLNLLFFTSVSLRDGLSLKPRDQEGGRSLNVPPEALLPPISRSDDPLNGLATLLGERGVVPLLKQIALIPEDRRGEVVRALKKIVG